METPVTTWLNEGLRHYSEGDAARALEAWYRILEVEPTHPAALEYVAFVRDAFRADGPPATADAATTVDMAAPVEAPAPVVDAAAVEVTAPIPVRRTDSVDSFSWADIVGDAIAMPPPVPAEAEVPAPLADPVVDAAASDANAVVEEMVAESASPLVEPPAPPGEDIAIEVAPPVADQAVADAAPVVDDAPVIAAAAEAEAPVGDTPLELVEAIELPDSGPLAAAPFEDAPVEEAPVEAIEVPDSGPIEVAPDDLDESVEISMADDEVRGLPSIIIADDVDVPDPPAAIPAAVFAAPEAVASREPSAPVGGDHDEVMPAPDAISAARAIPRRLTPMSVPAPGVDFDALVRQTQPSSFDAPSTVSAIEIAPVVLVPPVIDLPRAPTPMAVAAPSPPAHAPLEDRVMRQSIRFDEPRSTARSPSPPEVSPVVEHPASDSSSTPSPWDDAVGPAQPLDLDVSARPVSSFDTLLRSSAISSAPTIVPIEEEPAAVVVGAPVAPAAPSDGLESLMTGARELFELGDFSGSLELVEKVLRSNPQHEGALAYLKRNEATLMRMYESKIGDMTRIPRPLVPPDEVIWMNMHHRAGFILSQVDGTLSYEDILEVSGMDRFDTVRIVADLVSAGIIG